MMCAASDLNLIGHKSNSKVAHHFKYVCYAIAAAFAVGLNGCVQSDEPLPPGYLSHDKMVGILLDIHLVEGARSGTLMLGDTNRLADYYAKIYEKHNVTDSAFKTSFDWYTKHPEKLKVVYEEVLVNLSKLEEELKMKPNQ
jgi:hypothetical protein